MDDFVRQNIILELKKKINNYAHVMYDLIKNYI